MTLTKILFSSLAFGLTFFGCASKNDSVVKAKEQSKAEVSSNTGVRDTEFLTEMADARIMDFEEGKLAAKRGTSKSIRQYGQLMMNDQTKLLNELKSTAQAAHVVLPNRISEAKTDGLKDLKKTTGPKFDKKFISMIKIDHERDVKAFGEAKTERNAYSTGVQTFASKNLPLIEEHLQKIEAIEKIQQ